MNMEKENWYRIFPELNWIADEELRDKVISVYDEAMEIGGWKSAQELERLPFLIKDPHFGGTLVGHIRFVTQLSNGISETVNKNLTGYTLNHDYIIAAALLHDVAKVFGFNLTENGDFVKSRHEKLLRHCYSGAGLAMKHGLPEIVVHIIAVHAPEGDLSYRCPEAVIVNKSDFLTLDTMKAAKEW